MDARQALEHLARLHEVETCYEDAWRNTRRAGEAALLAILRQLGAPMDSLADAPDALVVCRRQWLRQCLEPVTVCQVDRRPALTLRVSGPTTGGYRARIELEDGEALVSEGALSDLPGVKAHDVAGEQVVDKQLRLDRPLPCGYHRARIELADRPWETLILCPPRRSFQLEGRSWGLFAPVYALRGDRSLGAGDLSDLEAILDWLATLGGQVLGTLPLLATFLDEPFDPSPYAPVSRMFWNEFYLDLHKLLETAEARAARSAVKSEVFMRKVDALRAQPLVDYRRQMALKRSVLGELARAAFVENGVAKESLDAFIRAKPALRDYAEFRAATDLSRKPWQLWPEPQRSGRLASADYREADVQYHLYVQWRSFQQMQALGDRARSLGVGLYLDLPLGVHDAGYDTWRERDAFLQGCSLGAPPDVVFTAGQHWGITPLDPGGLRRQGYRYFIECIRHHMRCAGALRIDHVMGLHRAYCIPEGMPASEGVFVRYRPEELYAVLAIESMRHRTLVVGEDLGTVPAQVRHSMKQAGVHRMHVLQYELEGSQRDPLEQVPPAVVASINTHDMVPFASWWQGSDIEDRVSRHLIAPGQAMDVYEERAQARIVLMQRLGLAASTQERNQLFEVLAAILVRYASSPAQVLLVNLEDLWLEREPQNVPATAEERPNWRRKLQLTLPEIKQRHELIRLLERIDAARAVTDGAG
ncbi:MAG: 4-alpha-glucanotransferase [Proteobacteria bacterium]|nr:4-alpha-glucanotransferase [Pseudomonadota bacterium]